MNIFKKIAFFIGLALVSSWVSGQSDSKIITDFKQNIQFNSVNSGDPTTQSVSNPSSMDGNTGANTIMTTTCGPDTVYYVLEKNDTVGPINHGTLEFSSGAGQWFDAPQNITVHGFICFAYMDSMSNATVDITGSIYNADPTDSTADNLVAPLSTVTLTIDSSGITGNVGLMVKIFNFTPPITVANPYVLTIEADNLIPTSIMANADGLNERLSSVQIGGNNWIKTANWPVPPGADIDHVILPIVSYDITADFAISDANPCQNDPVDFTNTSDPVLTSPFYSPNAFYNNPAFSFEWDYGDGSPIDNAVDGNHPYTSPGPFNVSLTDTMFTWSGTGFCTDQSVQAVNVQAGSAAVANFVHTVSGGTVTFTDAATGNPTSWDWDFGDASAPANVPSPVHTYADPGTYTVCLTVSGACGTNQFCDNVVITCPPPQTSWSSVELAGLELQFTDNTQDAVLGWQWDFGDGTFSNDPNPSHIYADDGYYDVCLTTNDSCGNGVNCQMVVVGCPDPIVDWTFTALGLQYNFLDDSQTDPASTYTWNFGDGTSSPSPSPQHTFPSPGIYDVCLYVLNNCGTDSLCITLGVACTGPSSEFVYDDGSLTVDFEDASAGNPSNWAWDFGDGNYSTLADPEHTFGQPGEYEVCLTVTNPCGSETTCDSVVVYCLNPETNFSFIANQNVITFNEFSDGFPDVWYWDFGDGNTSNTPDPVHTYTETGTYQVCLITSNFCSTDTFCNFVIIGCVPPIAGFEYEIVDSIITVGDTSSINSTSWAWDFGDGTTSTLQNPPAHVYPAAGDYLVCQTVTNSCDISTICRWITITCEMPTSGFIPVQNGGAVTFTDLSLIAQEYEWEFGDGSFSTDAAPVHQYTASGTYVVCQTVTNYCGENTSCQTLIVNCAIPDPDFIVTQDNGIVYFSDNTNGINSAWSWTFGDGASSNLQNPDHTFPFLGPYQVCLTVTNSCGTQQTCEEVLVSTVSIENNLLIDGFSIYPNPTQGLFTCSIQSLELKQIGLKILDLSGKVVLQDEIHIDNGRSLTQIDLSAFSDGMYFVEIEAEDIKTVQKIVKSQK